MIEDLRLRFAVDQNFFGNGTTEHTNSDVLDTKSALAKIGDGRPIRFRANVGTTAFSGGTSAAACIMHCATEGGTYVPCMVGEQILVASLAAGALMYDGPLPNDLKRYVKMGVVNVGNNAAGKASGRLYLG
jgi:hypothetical protein